MKMNPHVYKLSNGVTVILDPWNSATVSVRVAFQTGAYNENSSQLGITHFIEHMLCEGGRDFHGLEYLKQYGGAFNGVTNFGLMCLYGEMLPQNVSRTLDVFRDAIQYPRFDDAELKRERGAILDEYNNTQCDLKESFENYTKQDLNNGQPIKNVMGTPDTIKSFSRDQMLDFMHDNFVGRNCIITVSGKFDKNILNEIDKTFSFLPDIDGAVNAQMPQYTYRPRIVYGGPCNDNVAYVIPISKLDMHPYLYENRFYNACLLAQQQYLCFKLIQNLRHLVYVPPSMRAVYYGDIHMLWAAIKCNPAVMDNVITIAAQTIDSNILGRDKINDEYLQRHIQNTEFSICQQMTNVCERSRHLETSYMYSQKLFSVSDVLKTVRKLTVADILYETRNLFLPENISLAICGNGTQLDKIKAAWNKKLGRKSKIALATNEKSAKVQ